MNKINKFVPALLVAGVLALTVPFMTRAKAEPQQHKSRAVVIIDALANNNGLFVYTFSESKDAGVGVKSGDHLADVMVECLNQGMTLVHQEGPAFTFVR